VNTDHDIDGSDAWSAKAWLNIPLDQAPAPID